MTKFSDLEGYQQYLDGCDRVGPITLIVAKEAYEGKEAVSRTLSLCPKSDIQRFEGNSVSRGALFQELNAIPFFGDGAVVVLQEADKADKATLESLVSYAGNPNPAITFIMQASSLTKQSRLFKAVEKSGVVCQIVELRPWEKEQKIQGWIEARVREGKKRIDADAAGMLARQLGTNKDLLASEVEKLFCYVGDQKQITVADVTAICDCINLDTIWQLGESILRRESGRALKICRGLLSDGQSFLTLLWQLRSQMQTSFQICSLLQSGGGPQDVVQHFPYLKGRILERNMRLAEGYGLVRFKRGMLVINKVDSQVKNSAGPTDVLAEQMVAKLCQ